MDCNLCIFKNSNPDLCMNAEARIEGKGCIFGVPKEEVDKIKRCIVCGFPTQNDSQFCSTCEASNSEYIFETDM